MAKEQTDNSLYPIAVLIDELRNDDVKVCPDSLKPLRAYSQLRISGRVWKPLKSSNVGCIRCSWL